MRMGMKGGLAGIMLVLGGCASVGDAEKPAPPRPVADTIAFSAGACFGTCPIYRVEVEPDGSAVLYPQKFTSVPGETRFTVTPLQYRQLRDSFTAFRPMTGRERRIEPGKACVRMATDHPGYTIRWTREGQKATELYYYSGCHDAQYARLRAAVAAVPKLLDIEKMLKAEAPAR